MSVEKLDGTGKRILVIDDDLAIRVLLQAVLKRMKFDVELAEDGLDGLEKIEAGGNYDLILLDLMMPRMNGYELLDRTAEKHPRGNPHIIVFTAAGKRGVEKIAPERICSSILKPFDLDAFIEIIAACMSGQHAS